jgi:hypothetical protein
MIAWSAPREKMKSRMQLTHSHYGETGAIRVACLRLWRINEGQLGLGVHGWGNY